MQRRGCGSGERRECKGRKRKHSTNNHNTYYKVTNCKGKLNRTIGKEEKRMRFRLYTKNDLCEKKTRVTFKKKLQQKQKTNAIIKPTNCTLANKYVRNIKLKSNVYK